jgi:hypothetical protein
LYIADFLPSQICELYRLGLLLKTGTGCVIPGIMRKKFYKERDVG